MLALDSMLKLAARAEDWTHVVHRCAWCKRVADEHGEYRPVVVLREVTVVTDGMCPSCGTRALAEVAERRRLRALRAA